MFKKIFDKLILKRLKSLTPEEKQGFREALDKNVSEKPKKQKKQKRGKVMSDETKTEKVDKTEEKVDETKNDKVEKVEETEKEEAVKESEKPVGEQKAEPAENDKNGETETEQPVQVQETAPTGNGIRIEDLVTKAELMERLSAMEAKFDAVVKENQDLKDKYENKDFGNVSRQGVIPKDKHANDTFEEYSKQFM